MLHDLIIKVVVFKGGGLCLSGTFADLITKAVKTLDRPSSWRSSALSAAPLRCQWHHLRVEWPLCLCVSCPKQISRLDIVNLGEYAKLQQGRGGRREEIDRRKRPRGERR